MSASGRDIPEVLRRTREMFVNAQRGLEWLVSADPTRRVTGLHNVATFGRSVTLVAQTLSNTHQGFDEWYATYVEEMGEDPLLRYFVSLRNEILKEGGPRTTQRVEGMTFSTEDVDRLRREAPAGATSFFIGDRLGGSGWEVELPDGTTTRYYVDLPDSFVGDVRIHLPDLPTRHLGRDLNDPSLEEVCRLYVGYLERFVRDLENTFGPEELSQ